MIAEGRALLLAWYDENARDLPWRRTRDPYAIWVSEVMLQQTRVDTVIPYYQRFLERFPTMQALAEASEDDVLSSWSGLGYYRRARLLQSGVREAFTRYGAVPEGAEERRALPGIGAYTAGAIGSIAFERPEPIVDGNVARVLSRVHRIDAPLGETATTKRLWALAAEWAQGERPGALNQGLMELGATVCVPQNPRCLVCPLTSVCEARRHGEQGTLPRVAPKKAPREVAWTALVVRDAEGRVAFVRSEAKLFGGLYGVPMIEGDREAAIAAARALLPDLEVEPEALGTVRHVLSHRALTVGVHAARATSAAEGVRFRAPDALGDVGISTLTAKILETASGGTPGPGSRRATRAGAGSRTSGRRRASGRARADR